MLATILVGAVAACGGSGAPKGLRIGIAYDTGGLEDTAFNSLARSGVYHLRSVRHSAVAEIREFYAKSQETETDKYDRLIILCESGYNPVIAVGYGYAGVDPATGPLARAAKTCPTTKFATIDNATVTAPNVANLVFTDEQGAFLVGAAAALKSRTDKIGFVGGCKIPLVASLEAGYRAGARAVKPGITVDTSYVSDTGTGDLAHCFGFSNTVGARAVADKLYGAGDDVLFQAAGSAGAGVFESATQRETMAIGLGTDQHKSADPAVRDAIITSLLRRADTALYSFTSRMTHGQFTAGVTEFGLTSRSVGYATSGGALADIDSQLQAYRGKLIDGSIVLPARPAS